MEERKKHSQDCKGSWPVDGHYRNRRHCRVRS